MQPDPTHRLDLQPVLEGRLVLLRPLRREDWNELYAVASDPLIWEQHPARNRWQEDAFRRFFEEALDEVGERDCCGTPVSPATTGRGGAFAVIDRSTGRIIGSTRYHGYEPETSTVEIGWTFLARSHWGGRYNSEMKRLMLDHAFQVVERVIFLVGSGNIRSRTAIERLGAVNTGARQVRSASGEMIDHIVYLLTKDDRRCAD